MKIAIIGASGAIGGALVKHFNENKSNKIYAFAKSSYQPPDDRVISGHLDYSDEASIELAASLEECYDLVIVATGLLHHQKLMPEKSLRDLSRENLESLFFANTIGPSLVAKHFLPKLPKRNRGVMAFLSARVGSISDNQLGGWYGYRSSKAALNMIIKTASIEMTRKNPESIVLGYIQALSTQNSHHPFKKMYRPKNSSPPNLARKSLPLFFRKQRHWIQEKFLPGTAR